MPSVDGKSTRFQDITFKILVLLTMTEASKEKIYINFGGEFWGGLWGRGNEGGWNLYIVRDNVYKGSTSFTDPQFVSCAHDCPIMSALPHLVLVVALVSTVAYYIYWTCVLQCPGFLVVCVLVVWCVSGTLPCFQVCFNVVSKSRKVHAGFS